MRTHHAHQIVEAITNQIHGCLLALSSEESGPGPNPDVSDHFCKVMRERIARLREMRTQAEDLLSISTYPGF